MLLYQFRFDTVTLLFEIILFLFQIHSYINTLEKLLPQNLTYL